MKSQSLPSRWAFRFMLFYVCILFTQPQNRFPIFHPLHIADIAVIGSVVLHVLSATGAGRPIIRFGPATIAALCLMVLSYLSLFVGALQVDSHWNAHIDILFKSVIVVIMVEAMADSVQRVWAVGATMFLATLWWIKGGLRLAIAGSTYAGDRIMGPAVGIIENPNGFAYMLCVMLPLYLFFYQQVKRKWLKLAMLALALTDMFLVLKTGSRTGLMILCVMLLFLLPRYGAKHKTALAIGSLVVIFLLPHVGLLNMQRFKTIPDAIYNFLVGNTETYVATLDQDAQSAQERSIKNKHTWRLILQYPIFGVGIRPNEDLFPDELWGARGQVHNELLMAGKQMGIGGMSIYIFLVTLIFRKGRRAQHMVAGEWLAASDLGWTLKLQAVAVVVGGAFSPLPWNAVMFILAGTASSLVLALESRQLELARAGAAGASFSPAGATRTAAPA